MDLRQPVEQENANGEFYERLEWQLFSLKTQFDIMVAHFAARHFTTAKKILEEVV
jgi:hypothetical protein